METSFYAIFIIVSSCSGAKDDFSFLYNIYNSPKAKIKPIQYRSYWLLVVSRMKAAS